MLDTELIPVYRQSVHRWRP